MNEKEKIELIVIFTDGTRLIIDDVENYGSSDEEYHIAKNNWYSYLPRASVKYIGRLDHLRKEDRYDNFGN
jgi:hypothetical protein